MEEAEFTINDRFSVNSHRSEVIDNETGQRSRLEPRLMKLLCLLAKHQKEVVKREFIVKQIWDDYPGANESLNQAISFLRKLLADQDKRIIQTQPKAGYRFNVVISVETGGLPISKKNFDKRMVVLAALLLIIFFIVVMLYNKDKPTMTMKQRSDKDAGR